MNVFQSIFMPVPMMFIYTRKGGKQWNKSAKLRDWPWGLFLSPEKEHEVFICPLVKAGYTDSKASGCKRYFPFKPFVTGTGVKKAPLRQGTEPC